MTIVVAQALDSEDRGAARLGSLLARSLRTDLVLCGVLQHRWNAPAPARGDVAHAASLRTRAADYLAGVRRQLPDDVEASEQVRVARSIPAALHEEVIERNASMLVLGSAEDGVRGHIAVGSVADRLLHSASVPVAIAPRGYGAGVADPAEDGTRPAISRITVAVDSGTSSIGVLAASARLAHDAGVPLRMVTFAIRRKTMFPPEMGFGIEDSVLDAWREQASAGQRVALDALAARPDVDRHASVSESLVVAGPSWDHALAELDWASGDLLTMGSSSESVLSKVFLGSTATRLLRAAPVPTVVLPPSGEGRTQ